jgi:AraC-like DNA-binding protein
MTSFVRGIALLGFEEFATSQGLDPNPLLAESGLSTPDLDGLISGKGFADLLELCAARSGNPLFGLQFGLHQGSEALGNLLYVIRSASTVGEALEALIRYFHVHSSGAELRLEQYSGHAYLLYDITEGDAASVRQTVELAIGMGARLLQNLLGCTWKPSELLMRHKPGKKPGAYRILLGITPRFDSPVNAWVFDEDGLKLNLSATDERFRQLLKRQFDELEQLTLQELPPYVQKLLRSGLPNGNVTIELIAEQLMISPRTLQRYLQTEGTNFQELLDQTRQAMATRYICDSSISLTQISALLGYTSLGAFSRAFTRWNGISPQKWQQHYRRTGQLITPPANGALQG